jgi:hypothetical protein
MAARALVEMLIRCIEDGSVQRAFLTKLPEALLVVVIKDGAAKDGVLELQEVVARMQEFKQFLEKNKLLEPYMRSDTDALNSRADGMAKALRKLSMQDYHHVFVKRILVASLDWPLAERANCVALLQQLHVDRALSLEDVQWGAIHLLGHLDDLTLDCPGTSELVAEHLRALTTAGLLSAGFIRRCQLLRVGGAAGLAVLEAAQKHAEIPKSAVGETKNDTEEEDEEDECKADDEEKETRQGDVAEGGDGCAEPSAKLEIERVPPPASSGRLTGGLTSGLSLRPGGSLTGAISLRPGGMAGGLTSGLSSGGISLRPGGGGSTTGGPLQGSGGAASSGYPSADKKNEKKKKGVGDKVNANDSTSWRDDAAKVREQKERSRRRKDDKPGSAVEKDGSGAHSGKVAKLVSSETSWAAQQQKRRQNSKEDKVSDEEITRRMKSILNKLTLEKFDELYQQLVNCGISTEEHIRILIAEVFEKATMQHHFIEMYTLLCQTSATGSLRMSRSAISRRSY